MNDREAFETWVCSQPFFAYNDPNEMFDERDESDGGYIDCNLHSAWLAWNARSASAGSTGQEVLSKVIEMIRDEENRYGVGNMCSQWTGDDIADDILERLSK